jgi:transcriptional regulator with XRE-family HTH domain
MIRNTRQLRIAQARLRRLLEAWAESVDEGDNKSYSHLVADLRGEIAEFESIKEGAIREFVIRSLDDLGEAVVKARISSGMNQRELATELGVSEQAVQKDESSSYERASLARISDIVDVLGHEVVGVVRPTSTNVSSEEVGRLFEPAVQGRVARDLSSTNRQNSPQRAVRIFESQPDPVASGLFGNGFVTSGATVLTVGAS